MRAISVILVTFFLLSFSNSVLIAQTDGTKEGSFYEGIVTLEDGSHVNTFIKIEEWIHNPHEIVIKRPDASGIDTLTIREVRAFSVPGELKYIRSSIQVDVSRKKGLSVSEKEEPVYSVKEVFLNALIEGEASLYSYKSSDLYPHYYINTPETGLIYLIYKAYHSPEKGYRQNNSYRYQLYTRLACHNSKKGRLPKIEYIVDDLFSYVHDYNECTGRSFTTYEFTEEKSFVHAFFSVGINSTSVSMTYSRAPNSSEKDLDFETVTHLSLNAGIEWMLPIQSNDWSVLTGLSYQTFETSAQFSEEPYSGERTRIQAAYLNLNLELRKYFDLNPNHALFASGALGLSLNSSSQFHFGKLLYITDFDNALFYQISGGYSWKNLIFSKLSYTPSYNTFHSTDGLNSQLISLRFGIGLSF